MTPPVETGALLHFLGPCVTQIESEQQSRNITDMKIFEVIMVGGAQITYKNNKQCDAYEIQNILEKLLSIILSSSV